MKPKKSHARIYRFITDILTASPKYRGELINQCIKKYELPTIEMGDNSPNSKKNRLRSEIGVVINEMHAEELIGMDSRGQYYLITAKPVVIRLERCQKEIIKALSVSPMSKSELYNHLGKVFGTDKTTTKKDDNTLITYVGHFTKKMISDGIIVQNNEIYSLAPRVSARADDINALLALKSEFISRLHTNGGEFFENYFMSLLSDYCKKHGKKVLECSVTGGSADGGIDGIIKTEDSLGFREIVMVQTKNRLDLATETDVRGFYGAVCAKRGTRGIFAITSDFHSSASLFLDSLDDCVGISGDKIFAMATECSNGIKRTGKEFIIDEKLFS